MNTGKLLIEDFIIINKKILHFKLFISCLNIQNICIFDEIKFCNVPIVECLPLSIN